MSSVNTRTAYGQTLDYLYTRLPMFSRIGAAAIKANLDNTIALCAALGNPERKFRSVHIAGTNGKGSTSHMLAAIFQAAGYRTGLYTSPHLVDFRERIRIDGAMVDEAFVVEFVNENRALIEAVQPSFFEITVAMAFEAFAKAEVDIAIIETGLGGRLDSTNIITPELSVITNISLDHTDLLGPDIPSIAAEKAGIIKPGVPVVIGEVHPGSWPVFESRAGEVNAAAIVAEQRWRVTRDASGQGFVATGTAGALAVETDLRGSFQEKNLATVLAAVEQLRDPGWAISDDAVRQGLANVRQLTGLRGRWDIWQEAPLIIADVGHNPAGLDITLRDWQETPATAKHILIGFVRDKDVASALQRFPADATYYFCAAKIPRALPAAELAVIGERCGLRGEPYESVEAGLREALRTLRPEDGLLITGSFFIVGEAMQAYENYVHPHEDIG